MHEDWDALSLSDLDRLNIQAHRDSAKSTFWAIAYPLRRLCCWLFLKTKGEAEYDESGGIFGPSDDDAKMRLRQIREELERNLLIKRDFNPRRGSKWADDEFVLAGARDVKNPSLRASGLLSIPPGPRLSFAVVDDSVDPLHVESRIQRDKLQGALDSTLEPMMREDGTIVLVHTTYHNDDLPNRVAKDKSGRWYSRKWPLVIDMDRKIVQWAEHWPWERVRKAMMKPLIFSRQYQLQESRKEDRLLPEPEYFPSAAMEMTNGVWHVRGEIIKVAAGIDPAMTESDLKIGARSAIVVGGLHKNKDWSILQTRAGRWGWDTLLANIVDVQKVWKCAVQFIEEAAFGKIYKSIVTKTTSIPLKASSIMVEYMSGGKKKKTTREKISRITSTLNPPMSNHKIKLRDEGNEELAREIQDFPGDTVDCADALEHLIRNGDTDPVLISGNENVIRGAGRVAHKRGGSAWIPRYDD